MKTILSIDGGGIRGLIPAVILEALEQRLDDAGLGRELDRHFDLICGTSTGGIIAAGLTSPHPQDPARRACSAADLVRIYREDGQRIFQKKPWWERLRSLFRDESYDARPLEEMLREVLGEARLIDARTGVMLTAYDIDERRAVFMTNTRDDEEDYAAWEAARATSAAPTYFEPARIAARCPDGPRYRTLVDGGVFVNDPVFSAFVEGTKRAFVADDIHVFSIGTGYATRPYRYAEVRNWGLIDWLKPSNATPIISIMMHGQASSASYMAKKMLNSDPKRPRYVRIDMKLTAPAKDDLDDASPENLNALEDLARQALTTPEGEASLTRVVDWLKWRAGEQDAAASDQPA